MKLRDFSGGLNTLQPEDSIADNEFSTLLNCCYEEGGILRSRYGFQQIVQAVNVTKIYNYYVGGVLHRIYTCSGGLYDTGILLDANFIGPFIADEYSDWLYLCNGTYFKRYNGQSYLNVGVASPTTPTVSASDYDTITVEDFEDSPTYIERAAPYDGGTAGAVASDAVDYYDGAESIKVTCSEGAAIAVDSPIWGMPKDLTTFTTGASSDYDYFTVWYKANNAAYTTQFIVYIDCLDGSWTNYYSSGIIVPGTKYESPTLKRYYGAHGNFDVTTGEIVTQQAFSVEYMPISAGNWAMIRIPKGDFQRFGSAPGTNWATAKRLCFVLQASTDTASNNLVVNFDEAKIQGAAGVNHGLNGDYYFCASYYSNLRDEYYEVSEESGPVTLDTQNVDISSVPTTFSDSQADRYLVWARRADDDSWYLLKSCEAGGTGTETANHDQMSLLSQVELTEQAGIYPMPKKLASGEIKTRDTTNNTPPTATGDYICIHRGKLFIGDGTKIWHGKAGQPWAMPSDFYLEAATGGDPVQGMYSDGSTLIVYTKGKEFSYVNPGEYDQGFIYMGYLAKAKHTIGCVSKHTITDGLYCSSQGITTFDGQDGIVLSDKIKPTYRAITAKTALHACVFEDMYIIVDPNGYVIIAEKMGNSVRYYHWELNSITYCCHADRQEDALYIGTSTGVWRYCKDTNRDSDGAFTFSGTGKSFEYAPENNDMPLERWTVDAITGHNSFTATFHVDGVSHGTGTVTSLVRAEREGFFDLGSTGSNIKFIFSGSVATADAIKIYGIEAS